MLLQINLTINNIPFEYAPTQIAQNKSPTKRFHKNDRQLDADKHLNTQHKCETNQILFEY